ncbi:MAG TPA: hypothetical protein VFY87_06915 [Geminicoccaceae bacterium]|nr:hypothetical protein [Geminicoccaceae bacterium]
MVATSGQAAPAAVAEAARQLYRAAGREPPAVVLAATDPAAFVRLLQAAGRPPGPATPLLIKASSVVPGALAALGWTHGVRDPAFGALLLVLGVLLLLAAFGPRAGSEPTPGRVRADTATVLLLVAAAATLATAVTGSPAAGVATFALAASLAGLLRAAALANGGIPGRVGLATATGTSLATLASEPINEGLARELEDALAERRVGPILPAHPPSVADRDGWRRLEEVIRRRLGWARHEQAPILGRLVPAHRRHTLLAAESLAEPPALPAAALRLDRRCEAVSLFERAAVVLLRPDGERAHRAPRWWRPGLPPYAPVLGLLQASPVWHLAIALAPSTGLADRLLARLVAGDPDPALRMDAIERIGFERFFAALGASPVDHGAAGALFVAGQRPLATAVVRVEDKVPDADGHPQVHWLPVPPHVATAREAVAWTFGKREQDWDPLVET